MAKQVKKQELVKIVDIQMKISTVIQDGEHEGKITNVLSRTTEQKGESYTYVNIEIETSDVKDVQGNPITLNCSAPANLSKTPEGEPNSKLAKMLVSLGYNLDDLTSISIEKMLEDLEGKAVSFMTINETSERGTFATILEKSLKLL